MHFLKEGVHLMVHHNNGIIQFLLFKSFILKQVLRFKKNNFIFKRYYSNSIEYFTSS